MSFILRQKCFFHISLSLSNLAAGGKIAAWRKEGRKSEKKTGSGCGKMASSKANVAWETEMRYHQRQLTGRRRRRIRGELARKFNLCRGCG
jgi:hypothetical protein